MSPGLQLLIAAIVGIAFAVYLASVDTNLWGIFW